MWIIFCRLTFYFNFIEVCMSLSLIFTQGVLLSDSFHQMLLCLKAWRSTAVWIMCFRWPLINSRLRPSSPPSLVYPERPSGPLSTCPPHPLWPSVFSAERAAHPRSGRNPISQFQKRVNKEQLTWSTKHRQHLDCPPGEKRQHRLKSLNFKPCVLNSIFNEQQVPELLSYIVAAMEGWLFVFIFSTIQ